MITEDLTVFLADFGVSVTAGAVSGLGILDMPGEVVMDDNVISTAYRLTCLSSEFGELGYGDQVVADGLTYLVQELQLITDGRFCTLMMERVMTVASQIITSLGNGVVLLTEDNFALVF
jgi:hypothetical protein